MKNPKLQSIIVALAMVFFALACAAPVSAHWHHHYGAPFGMNRQVRIGVGRGLGFSYRSGLGYGGGLGYGRGIQLRVGTPNYWYGPYGGFMYNGYGWVYPTGGFY